MPRARLGILRILLLNLLVCLILLEVVSLVYLKFILKADPGRIPTYMEFQRDNAYDTAHDPLGPHFIDTAYPWSTWHPLNSRFRQKGGCIDQLMVFNAEGTRGSLPDTKDSNTVLFLGDSFTEGWGLSEESTIASVVSKRLGSPTLNLGISGYVGTTQQSLIYSHFAPRYRHRRLYMLLYLANDMYENDIRLYDKKFGSKKRYRPYRADTSNLGHIVYKGSLDSTLFSWESYRRQRSQMETLQLRRYGLWPFLKGGPSFLPLRIYQLTYTSRLIHMLMDKMQSAGVDTLPDELKYDAWDLRILSHDLGIVMDEADRQGVEVVFVNLPSMNMWVEGAKDSSVHRRYVDLEAHVRKTVSRGRHRYLSFYEYTRQKKLVPSNLVFTCDTHLNETGIGYLADMLLQDQPK